MRLGVGGVPPVVLASVEESRELAAVAAGAAGDGRPATRVRPARPDDVPALLELARRAQAESAFRQLPFAPEKTQAALRQAAALGNGV